MAIVLAAAPTHAQRVAADITDYDPAILSSCLASKPAPECIGVGVHDCVEATPNLASFPCGSFERDQWNEELDQAYARAFAFFARYDLKEPRPEDVERSREQALRDSKAAWEVWQSTTCDYDGPYHGTDHFEFVGLTMARCTTETTAAHFEWLSDMMAPQYDYKNEYDVYQP
ncbi:lysozyme inhibitor LprI family protein [Jannaschia sp. AI_61]|nr:lysozyme inhibitor LprI family protein [Jannaschia sp. AI_61]